MKDLVPPLASPLTRPGIIWARPNLVKPEICVSVLAMSMRVALLLVALLAVGVLGDIPRRSYIASFGSNGSERLGRPSSSAKPVVGLVCPKQRCGVRQFSVANSYVIANTALGDYAWGSNAQGQLPGLAITSNAVSPTIVPPIAPTADNVYRVLDDACLMNADSTTYGYGSNNKGQLSALNQTGWSVGPVASPSLSPVSLPSNPASKRDLDATFEGQSQELDQYEQGKRSSSSSSEMLAPPYTNTQTGTLPFSFRDLSCAATRCYYQNSTSTAWGYWGDADYDPSYDFRSSPLRRLDFSVPNLVSWIVHSRTTVILKTATGVKAMGFFLNSSDPLIAQPISTLTPACEVNPRMRDLSLPIDVGDGFVAYVCSDYRTVYTFGNNTFGQLGNSSITDDYVPGLTDSNSSVSGHVLVSIPFSTSSEYIVDISAGMASTYVLTSAGDVYGWGYSGLDSLGPETQPNIDAGHFQNFPALLSYYSADSVKNIYQSIAIRSTASAHGFFVGLAMRPGTIGTTCNSLPSSVTALFNMSDLNSIFCDIQGYYNLNSMTMAATENALVNVVMKVRGDMSMSGASKMASLGGMVLEGDITLNDTAQAVISGLVQDAPNFLDGSLFLSGQSQIQLENTSLQVSGDVDLSHGATLTFANLTNSLLNESSIVVNVSGSIAFNGSIAVVITQAEVDALIEATLGRGNRREYLANDPASPDAATPAATNATLTTVLISTEGTIVASSTATTSITVAQPSNSCAKASGSLVPSSGSLSMVVSISVDSECTPGSPKGGFGKDRNTTGIIIGSVFGGIIACFVIAAIVILSVKPIREKLLPYRDATARRTANTTQYQAATNEP